MAKKEPAASGSLPVPKESVELEGGIITAATSTMEPKSFAEGYPEPAQDDWKSARMKQ